MNIKKVEKQLRKINQLFENIKEDGTVSSIERDLMMSYVRELYEKLMDSHHSDDKHYETKVVREKVKKEVKKPKQVYIEQDSIANVVLQEVKEAAPVVAVEEIEAAPEKAQPPTVQIIEEPQKSEESIPSKPEVPQELLDLFEFDSINELSDKLSRSPIRDLTKSMGINEKIFTVQELFGGDSALFAKAMETMDKFTSLEQARDYLVEHIAVEQKWTSEDKIKKAANFIKLISRRF